MEIVTMEVDYLDIIEAVVENRCLKISLEFDQVMHEYTERLLEIEEICLNESATEDIYFNLIQEEVKETADKSRSLLSRLIKTVKSFFATIKKAIVGEKKEYPEEVELSMHPNSLVRAGQDLISSIKKALHGDKDSLKKALGVGALGAGAVVLAKDAIAPAIKTLESFVDDSESVLDEAGNVIDNGNTDPESQGLLKSAVNKLRGYGNHALQMIKAVPKMGTQEYRDRLKEENDKKKEKSVLRRGAKTLKGKITDSVQASVDSQSAKKILSADEIQKINAMSLDKLRPELATVEKDVKELTAKIATLKKKNAQGGVINRNMSGLARKKRRLEHLTNKDMKRSAKEDEERDALAREIADSESGTQRQINDLEKELKKAIAKRNMINKNITTRRRENARATDRAASAISSKNLHGTQNTQGNT